MKALEVVALAAILATPAIGIAQHQHHGGHAAPPPAVNANASQ